MIRIAILDDYQNASLEMADWSTLAERAVITVFNDHLSNLDDIVERLLPFDVICVMRERTPLRAPLLNRLPKLKLIASTGPSNASIDLGATAERGIAVAHTAYTSVPTIELTWALILASARHIPAETASVRGGGWQRSLRPAARSCRLRFSRARSQISRDRDSARCAATCPSPYNSTITQRAPS